MKSGLSIALVNGKGGVGKTTVSLLLASAFIQSKNQAWLDDRDPQQSGTLLAGNLDVPLEPIEGGVTIIDTAPRIDHPPTVDAIRSADIVILVSSPSPADLSTTIQTAHVIKQVRHETKPVRILFNSVQTGTRLASEIGANPEMFPFPRLKNSFTRRQSYQLALMNGWKVLPAVAREEVKDILTEILTEIAAG